MTAANAGGDPGSRASAIRSTRRWKVPPKKKAEIQALADSLLKPITVVEEETYQVKNRAAARIR